MSFSTLAVPYLNAARTLFPEVGLVTVQTIRMQNFVCTTSCFGNFILVEGYPMAAKLMKLVKSKQGFFLFLFIFLFF